MSNDNCTHQLITVPSVEVVRLVLTRVPWLFFSVVRAFMCILELKEGPSQFSRTTRTHALSCTGDIHHRQGLFQLKLQIIEWHLHWLLGAERLIAPVKSNYCWQDASQRSKMSILLTVSGSMWHQHYVFLIENICCKKGLWLTVIDHSSETVKCSILYSWTKGLWSDQHHWKHCKKTH